LINLGALCSSECVIGRTGFDQPALYNAFSLREPVSTSLENVLGCLTGYCVRSISQFYTNRDYFDEATHQDPPFSHDPTSYFQSFCAPDEFHPLGIHRPFSQNRMRR
jgi:hypothetical protein